MLSILKTLSKGATARNEAKLRNHYALDLIDQKIRETETALKMAKATLASQIQRSRAETRQLDQLRVRITDVTKRAQAAFDTGHQELATDAAKAVADLENEQAVRSATLTSLDQQIQRLRLNLEKSQRNLVDLRQGALMAKSVRSEQQANAAITRAMPATPAREARELIDDVLAKDSPAELDEIFEEVVESLNHSTIEDRLGQAGYGPKTRISGADVLARFSAGTDTKTPKK